MTRFTKKAFTLVELLVVIALLGGILTFAVPAIANAKTKSSTAQAQANCNLLNGFARAIREQYLSNAGTIGSDKVAALEAYYDMGYLDRPISIKYVVFSDGFWAIDPVSIN